MRLHRQHQRCVTSGTVISLVLHPANALTAEVEITSVVRSQAIASAMIG